MPQKCRDFKIVIPIMIVGGVLFKVYIVGETIKVVRCFSLLDDVCKRELSKNAGVYHVPGVSCAAASADDANLDPRVAGELSCLTKPFLIFLFVFQESCISSWVWFALFRWVLNLWKKMFLVKGWWG